MAIQQLTEEATLLMAREAMALAGSRNLCLAGGVALNCVSNGKLAEAGILDDIFVQPAAGDAGGAPGAALAAFHIHFGRERVLPTGRDAMQGAYLGPGVEDYDVRQGIRKYNAEAEMVTPEALGERVARLISEGNVVGWVQGRMEFGPRALGARSILGDPRSSEMQQKLNLKIKYRESFRPFAPVVLAEDASQVFEMDGISPYMLMVHGLKKELLKPLPSDYQNLGLREKLYVDRSQLPAITHVDHSARIQTVHEDTNPRFYRLLQEFKKLTGFGVLVNTSFNVRGEPIVCTPEVAYRCFMRTEMDILVAGDYIFEKSRQPAWQEKAEWQTEFVLD
jgi:carbamoyltransferase